jgi:hypothetical protein
MKFTELFFNSLLKYFNRNEKNETYYSECDLGGMSSPSDKDYEI